MSKISDFDDADRWVVEAALKKHYGKITKVELADSEIRLDPTSIEVTVCPTFYWQDRGTEFVVFKSEENKFRGKFIYSANEQYDIGGDFDELSECAAVTLKLQANHEKTRAGAAFGKTAEELKV